VRRLFLETNFLCTACDPLDLDYGTCQQILDIARRGSIEVLIPEMSFHESHHVFRLRADRRHGMFENLKQLVRNGGEAGFSVCKRFDLERFDLDYMAILNSLDHRDMLTDIKNVAISVSPSSSFSSTSNAIRAAMTTGREDRPFLMTEIDHLALSTVVDFCKERALLEEECLFCSRDEDMVDACETVLPIVDYQIEVTDDFKAALSWAAGGSSWRTKRRRKKTVEDY
jgi:hypothetical protein